MGDKAAVLNALTWEFTTVDVFYDTKNDGANVEEVLKAYFVKVGRGAEQSSEVIIRHDRNDWYNSFKRKCEHSVLTVAAKIDYSEMTLKFGWAVCVPGDNFCKATGRERAVSRLDTEEAITIPYNAGLSILDNIIYYRHEDRQFWNLGLIRHLRGRY